MTSGCCLSSEEGGDSMLCACKAVSPSSILTSKPVGQLATGLSPGAQRLSGFSGRPRLSIGDNPSVLIFEGTRRFLPFHSINFSPIPFQETMKFCVKGRVMWAGEAPGGNLWASSGKDFQH